VGNAKGDVYISMKFLFIENSGEGLPVAARLDREAGHKVVVYIHNERFQRCFDGMLDKTDLKGLSREVEKAHLVVFSMNKPVENEHDKSLQKLFGATGDGLFGSIADALRKQGKIVLGVSAWGEKAELARQAGSELATKIGLAIPETHKFQTLGEGAKFLKGRRNLWVFKPFENQDLDLTYLEQFPGELLLKLTGEYKKRLPEKTAFILQEKIEGNEIDSEAWFNGSRWVCHNHTVEDKHFLTGNLGMHVGSMNNTVWMTGRKGLLSDVFNRLAPYAKKNGHIGPWNITTIVSNKDRKPYFLEHSPRMGWDALYCLLTLLNSPLSAFFEYVSGMSRKRPAFNKGFASSIRISIPPYPYEDEKLLERARDVAVGGNIKNVWLEDVYKNGSDLKCAGADGIIGVLAMRGLSVAQSAGKVYRAADKLKIGSYLEYRTDLGARARETLTIL